MVAPARKVEILETEKIQSEKIVQLKLKTETETEKLDLKIVPTSERQTNDSHTSYSIQHQIQYPPQYTVYYVVRDAQCKIWHFIYSFF
jgi:hypothetical protein